MSVFDTPVCCVVHRRDEADGPTLAVLQASHASTRRSPLCRLPTGPPHHGNQFVTKLHTPAL